MKTRLPLVPLPLNVAETDRRRHDGDTACASSNTDKAQLPILRPPPGEQALSRKTDGPFPSACATLLTSIVKGYGISAKRSIPPPGTFIDLRI